jgi:hypothetical protein
MEAFPVSRVAENAPEEHMGERDVSLNKMDRLADSDSMSKSVGLEGAASLRMARCYDISRVDANMDSPEPPLREELAMITVHHLGVSQSERVVWLCEELEIPYALHRYDRDPTTRMAPGEYKA